MNNLDHIQIELEEKRAEADDIEKMFDVALGEIAHEHVSEIKPIDEHEWSDGQIDHVCIDSDGDIEVVIRNRVEAYFNDSDLAVLANARGFDLVKRGDSDE